MFLCWFQTFWNIGNQPFKSTHFSNKRYSWTSAQTRSIYYASQDSDTLKETVAFYAKKMLAKISPKALLKMLQYDILYVYWMTWQYIFLQGKNSYAVQKISDAPHFPLLIKIAPTLYGCFISKRKGKKEEKDYLYFWIISLKNERQK